MVGKIKEARTGERGQGSEVEDASNRVAADGNLMQPTASGTVLGYAHCKDELCDSTVREGTTPLGEDREAVEGKKRQQL